MKVAVGMRLKNMIAFRAGMSLVLSLVSCARMDSQAVPKEGVKQITSKDIAVIAWIDGDAIPLPQDASKLVTEPLNGGTLSCYELLFRWSLPVPFDLTDQDRAYANAFLLKRSSNKPPPKNIDTESVEKAGDYRLFNRVKVSFAHRNGQIGRKLQVQQHKALIGVTRDPCGSPGSVTTRVASWFSGGEPHPLNGRAGTIHSQATVFHLNAGRMGFAARLITSHINNRPRDTIPWIWSVVLLKESGDLVDVDHQMFPTYFIYADGKLVRKFSQGTVLDFFNNSRALEENRYKNEDDNR